MGGEPAIRADAGNSLWVVAGEASGDLHGAALGRELLRLRPELALWGVGGPRMAEVGFRLFYDSSAWGAIGIAQALRIVPRVAPAYFALKRRLASEPPDLLILIDFGFFNLRLGRAARRLGIPVLYYFPPRSWDRNLTGPGMLAEACDYVVTPFPWSAELLRQAGMKVQWFGHPLLDLMPSISPEEARASLGLREATTLGLFPGSRVHEVKANLPRILAAACLLRRKAPDLQLAVSQAPNLSHNLYAAILRRAAWAGAPPTVTDNTWTALAASDAAMVCSGTITLEAALARVPMVVVYTGTWGMWLQYRLFYKKDITFIAMPNLLAGRRIVPEFIQEQATPTALAEAAAPLLWDEEARQKTRQALAEVRSLLGSPGAVAQTAQTALSLLSREQ